MSLSHLLNIQPTFISGLVSGIIVLSLMQVYIAFFYKIRIPLSSTFPFSIAFSALCAVTIFGRDIIHSWLCVAGFLVAIALSFITKYFVSPKERIIDQSGKVKYVPIEDDPIEGNK